MAYSHGSKLHIAMIPFFAYGHMIPYLHLSNKLAEKGHRVSFMLPKGVTSKLQPLNSYPDLITFVPLVVPQVDGLPSGAETTAEVPFHLHETLHIAMDKTKDQVETILSTLKPHCVFFDGACWIPALTRQLNGMVSVYYSVVNVTVQALYMVPSRRMAVDMTLDEFVQPPPGYPSSKVVFKPEEATRTMFHPDRLGDMVSKCKRITTSMKESDVMAFRTCREIEGLFCHYIAEQYAKPLLLTGPAFPESADTQLEEKWANWLSSFEVGSVVYCAFGSQNWLNKNQFQELLLGFELSGRPFLVALSPPEGCSTVEEALPEGFEERVQGRGWVCRGWAPQKLILEHPSVGCFVSHCGFGSLLEGLLSDCQMVMVPYLPDQIVGTRLLVEEFKVAVEVERAADGWIPKENLTKAIELVMDKDSGSLLKSNHAKLKKELSRRDIKENYLNNFIDGQQNFLTSKN